MSPTIRPRTVVDEKYEDQTRYTINLDLPESGLVSTMWLICHARTHDTPGSNEPYMKYLISSISMNQAGQEALNAARPQAFQASYYYKTGKFPKLGRRQFSSDVADVEEVIPILFGEKIDDFEHYVDLSKLNDPKLSVTYDLATTGLLSSTIWDTAYPPRFSVVMDFIEGPDIPASKGYYSLRQIDQYDTTDDLVKLTELKGGRPIKRLLLEHYVSGGGYEWMHLIDLARIHGDNEAWVPFRITPERWAILTRAKFGTCKVTGQLNYAQDNVHTDCIVAKREMTMARVQDAEDRSAEFHGGSGLMSVLSLPTWGSAYAVTNDRRQIYFQFIGILPWNIQVIDMPKMLNMEHLDPTEHAPVYLELDFADDAATTGEVVRVNIEDLVQQ